MKQINFCESISRMCNANYISLVMSLRFRFFFFECVYQDVRRGKNIVKSHSLLMYVVVEYSKEFRVTKTDFPPLDGEGVNSKDSFQIDLVDLFLGSQKLFRK